jgi:hypothetical protein
MPTEKRDHYSGAKIFVPTPTERATVQQARELKKQLAEVEVLKQELQKMLDQMKGS